MIKFGTGGWRGIIAEDFTFDNVRKVAKALSIYYKKNFKSLKPVIVGHDLRFLSGRFSRAFSEILAEEGIKVYFVEDASPTPMIMYGVEKLSLDFGVMITASHNPHEYNGIKIIVEKGKDAPVTVTDELERIANSIDGKLARRNFFEYINEEKIVYYENKNEYIDSLLAFIDTGCIKNRSFKILFNPMYGVSKDIMLMCLASLRCYVDLMNAYRDTMFGLKLPSPERKSLLDMEYKMKEKKYDMGIATDGDSDRIGIYDENGNYIDANKILVLLYYYLLKYKGMKGGVVRNLTTTHTLDKIAEKFGERAFEVPVGFKYISEKMEEYDLLLGGESSGGLKIRGHVNGKDGILAALLMVEMVCKTGKTIGALLKEIEDEFGKKYFKMENIKITNKELLKKRFFEDKYVPEIGKKVKRISYMDGLKIYYDDDTWLSIRFSGTEPVLRITCEMNSEDEAANVIERIISVMR
ncbi:MULTISPECIES: phosphoglucomutase/phosphomannomutase alpha/beta/alpha domain I [Kosmotoga]|uniref:Phosphoglucomutase/phosphomannomutase alpha/beta/alpha domain I n=1 Tax=Kosmotoga olearia (strain ATCC BAA-1733 / DSM 21960 / TBF 19.5.1) TaxID=521045 RepID=C5CDP6_KOSOT|nr:MULTISPECIES: phosphoglucomutase/phosphomannomutase alpha/beta/alpha domain I [Kosmotoga]ACR80058.1 phosphoglucomutase/phosphomannomutase alpha/beta/alpha domain I [Kosmotoga olearia TBF 19.5.1]MDI3524291.1 hypothetical protein [Kosmotoga sp.]MDK2954137.1 hypothetical protein [Kosmotoga sp.]OAA20496.1 phosphomutase [Kosmotoga sp. DU53]